MLAFWVFLLVDSALSLPMNSPGRFCRWPGWFLVKANTGAIFWFMRNFINRPRSYTLVLLGDLLANGAYWILHQYPPRITHMAHTGYRILTSRQYPFYTYMRNERFRFVYSACSFFLLHSHPIFVCALAKGKNRAT